MKFADSEVVIARSKQQPQSLDLLGVEYCPEGFSIPGYSTINS